MINSAAPRIRFRQGFLQAFMVCGAVVFGAGHGLTAFGGQEVENAVERRDVAALPTDRKTTVQLEAFRRHVKSSEFDAAFEDLRRLQTSDPFAMVPSENSSGTYVPLYRAVFLAFHKLPPSVRDRATAAMAAAADRSLRQALSDGKPEALPDLILRFAGTEASLNAHLVLARMHLDRGNQLAAKTWLTPLTVPSIAEPHRETAMRIVRSLAASDTTGNAQRAMSEDAVVDGRREASEIPAHQQWQFPDRPVLSARLTRQIATFLKASGQADFVPPTTWSDRLDGDTAFRRTMGGVAAIDLATGESRWQSLLLPQLDVTITANRENSSAFDTTFRMPDPAGRFAVLEKTPLASLFCRDNLTGQVSGDAERLYLIANEKGPIVGRTSLNRVFSNSSRVAFRGSRMVALEKKTGRRVWTVGSNSFGQLGMDPSGGWFVGVPRIVRNQLFAVFEWKGELRLGCFAARTGEFFWSTALAYPEQAIDKDQVRQFWSATPTVDQGLIWCPTTAGWMSCVDEVTHSVLWASIVRGPIEASEPVPVVRGRPLAATRLKSLRERWALSQVVRAGEGLVVAPHESHEIILLDSATGHETKRIAFGSSAAILHLDETMLVMSEQSLLTGRSSVTGEQAWARPLTSFDGIPSGRPVRRGNSLLMPMTTGAIVRLELSTGKTVETAPDALPAGGWGDLVEVSGSADLFYAAPDRLIRFSFAPPENHRPNPIQLALDRMQAEQWQEALALAESVAGDGPEYSEARGICFDCRERLAVQQPDVHLPRLKEMAESLAQRVRVQVLETQILLSQQEFTQAAEHLTEILKLGPTQLSKPGPVSLKKPVPQIESNGAMPVVVRSLQTWAAAELTEVLNRLPEVENVLQRFEEVPAAVLLNIHHPALLQELHRRISESSSAETALQLLQHAVDLQITAAVDNAPDFSIEVDLFVKLVSRLSERANTPVHKAAMLLVNVTALEMPAGFLAAIQETDVFRDGLLQSREGLGNEFRSQLGEEFAGWSAESYRAIPVMRSLSYGQMLTMLTLSESDDLFLSRFRWTAVRGEFGRLQAREFTNTEASQWSIAGKYHLFGTFSQHRDIIERNGSVVLLRSFSGITAISVLDQKVLWSQSFSTIPGLSTLTKASGNFERFNPERDRLPSWQQLSTFQIVGTGHRWLALQAGGEVKILDAYSGHTLWSIESNDKTDDFAVTDRALVRWSRSGADVVGFDRRNGQYLPDLPGVSSDVAALTPIRNFDRFLVCWKQSADGVPTCLQWIDPLTATVSAEVSLPGMQRFQFVDDRILAGFNSQAEMLIVDLKWRTSQRYSFGVRGGDLTESPIEEQNADDGPPDVPFWAPERIQVSADRLNYYACNRISHRAPQMRAPPLRVPSERQLTVFQGGLRAIDRETGQLRWWIHNDELLMSTTDQPELPVLVLISSPAAAVPNQGTSRSVFRGISKLTGKQLFNQIIPSQYGLRNLWLTSTARDTLDVGVQGLRIRLEGQPRVEEDN